MKGTTIITIFAVFWFTWELFFSTFVDVGELILIVLNIEYNDTLILVVKIIMLSGFLFAFLWLRSRTNREKQYALRRIP